MGSVWDRKVRKGRRKPKVMQTKKVRGLWQAHKPQEWE